MEDFEIVATIKKAMANFNWTFTGSVKEEAKGKWTLLFYSQKTKESIALVYKMKGGAN